MTPQEEQLLDSLVERVNQTQLQEKDFDAEALLQRELGPNTDALYILAQTVLVQNIALEQAKAQIAQLQQQAAPQPAHATSFLGSLLGRRDPAPAPPQQAPQQGYQPVNPQYTQPQYAPSAPQYMPPYDPQYGAMPPSQPSFLRGAMQTAAGVAAGALAFEGVESILHGFGHPGYGWGEPGMGGGFGGGFERPVEETVINNNYYDDPRGQSGGEPHAFEQGDEHHLHETADRGGAQFSDASYNTSGDGNELDAERLDDTASYDDSSLDDGGSFNDGGGVDSGGDVL